jgi:TolB protein
MRRALLTIAMLALSGSPLWGQDPDRFPGVQLVTTYTLSGQQALAVQPFSAAPSVTQMALQITQIVENDLRFSDRFRMMPVPSALASGPIDYAQWNSLNLSYLVTGTVTALPSGYQLEVTVHDVPYGTVKQKQTFSLPMQTSPDFRMAVHVAADEIVRWIRNEPGSAASRIVFRRKNPNNSFDLMVVDSDGENARRLFGSTNMIYSPAFSPDGRKLVYALAGQQGWSLVERDLTTGRTRNIHGGPDIVFTPTYSPDGTKVAFGVWVAGGAEIHEFDVARNCCLRKLTDSRGDNMMPSYSPDGRTMVFHSTRTGSEQIYVMPAAGGPATLLSPLGERVSYAGPEWSPMGSEVVFDGRLKSAVRHLMLGDATRFGGQIRQLTSGNGWNEDPSWAPDGRHIVFTSSGIRGDGPGLYVLDKITGNIRRLLSGQHLDTPDWSGPLSVQPTASRQ